VASAASPVSRREDRCPTIAGDHRAGASCRRARAFIRSLPVLVLTHDPARKRRQAGRQHGALVNHAAPQMSFGFHSTPRLLKRRLIAARVTRICPSPQYLPQIISEYYYFFLPPLFPRARLPRDRRGLSRAAPSGAHLMHNLEERRVCFAHTRTRMTRRRLISNEREHRVVA